MTDGRTNAPGPHSKRFLDDFRVYDFRSFVSLDGSERSVFCSTIALPSYRITELSRNNVFDKKEKRKERSKTILCFRPQAVSNSGDSTASVEHRSSFGSTQEYLVSIYISKTIL